MQNKKIWIAMVVVAIIALGAYVFPQVKQQVRNLGDVSSPELFSPFWKVNDVEHRYESKVVGLATTTPCSWLITATSTLLYTSFNITNGTSSALVITLATSTAPNATTTLLTNEKSLASGIKTVLEYRGTTTPVTAVGNGDRMDYNTLKPNDYVTWGVEGVLGFTNPNEMGISCKLETLVN